MERQPNILIFMTDHQRGDTVIDGNGTIMPNIKKFRENGLTFTNCFCPMPHCCPSRASFFTGLYPSQHGVWNNLLNTMALSDGLKDGVRLFSEDLRDGGYRLGYSGKWHVSNVENPVNRGFEELFVGSKAGDLNMSTWDEIEKSAPISMRHRQIGRMEGQILRNGYSTHQLYGRKDEPNKDENTVSLAVNKIREYANEQKPWCLYVGTGMPHTPYYVPQKYLDMYPVENVQLPKSYYDTLEDKPNYYRKLRQMCFGQLSELEYRQAIRHFRAMCTYLDELFGRLMTALEETNQLGNTLVLYTSDHGDYAGEHGLFHKGVPAFRGAYNVPAVIGWPASISKPGSTVDELVSIADFAPTFLDAAGIKPVNKMIGASLLPFIKNIKSENWRNAIFAQCNGVENYFTQRSVITKDYRYTYNGFDFDEFYDLRNDPDEMINRNNDHEFDEIKKSMCRQMWEFARETGDGLAEGGSYVMVSTAAYGPEVIFQP